jgi:hypothetical protein
MTEAIPYQTLVELAVIQDEINDAWDTLSNLDNRLGGVLAELAGPMSDEASDAFWKQLSNDVDDARGQARVAG